MFAVWRGALCLALVLGAAGAHAWGRDGHAIVATLAQALLSPKARAEVEKLLAQEPGATLVSIASWADEHRTAAPASWHYANFPKGTCKYDPARDCPGGNCVVAALGKQLELLKSGTTEQERLPALKYVVHLVGDIHQPLHVGYAEDKGGNSYQVRLGERGTNLHSLWDSGMLRNLGTDPMALAATLQSRPVAAFTSVLDPVVFAEESCEIVQADGFYPDRFVSDAYLARYVPIMQERLTAAGARLAAMLNATFQ